MNKILIFIFTLFLFPFLPQKVLAQQIDIIDFMRANFNYNGFTQYNSYLAQTVNQYDKATGKWTHFTELSYCPQALGNCTYSNWKARYMTRQKPGENILYLSKTAFPGKSDEVFWFNKDWVYAFQEPFSRNTNDYGNLSIFGLFHNLYHLPDANPQIEFPYRGQFWSKRFVTPGEEMFPVHQVIVNEYRNMQMTVSGLKDNNIYPYTYRIKADYYPRWDSTHDSWNNQPDNGNLPSPLEVLVLEGISTDDAGNLKPSERYFYARSGSNSFGLIRFELWEPKTAVCGSGTCCTTPSCDSSNPLTLTMSNNYNILSHYDPGEDPNQYFIPSFYSDPKLEAYPGDPTNGALPRGRFQLPGNGFTTDGKQLKAGDWMQLTEILTDGDWMLSQYQAPNQCPDGYQYLGSMSANYYDQRGTHQDYGWVVLCGTNKNVFLATSCPDNYFSRGWFDTSNPTTSVYDYQGKPVGGQTLNYCVTYNEFHYPKITPTSSPTPTFISGDLNHDGHVNIFDYNLFIPDFGKTGTSGWIPSDIDKNGSVNIFDYNILLGNFGK